MLHTFPDPSYNVKKVPLQWAVALKELGDTGIDEEDIKRLYVADPMSLEKHHLEGDDEITSYSPAHFLCMQPNPP